MSYEVTATRRRPQSFDALVGQEFVAETFRNSIKSKKIAHAYLFSGPRGCGKTSTARILAKALNCQEGPASEPCGKCQQCQEITKGTCLDVIEIDGASNTSINDIRQIKSEILFPPQSCRYKIYIIDEVHMISDDAFNALLKTIEEPPPYVIFIFATTELQKVPATIKSRCQQFNFRLVPVEKVKEQLAQAASEAGIKAQDEALFWIARESTGSMRDAYTLFDQVAAFSGDEITFEKIRDKLGLVGLDRLNEIFEACACGNRTFAMEKIDSSLQGGISIEQLISNATDYLRSLLLIKNGVTKESLLGQSAEQYSKKVLETWNCVQIERGISLFLQLYRDIRYSLSPRYELELAFSRLCWLSDYVSPAEVKVAMESAKNLLLKSQNQSFRSGGAEPPQQSAGNSFLAPPEKQQSYSTFRPQTNSLQGGSFHASEPAPVYSAPAEEDYSQYSYAPDNSDYGENSTEQKQTVSAEGIKDLQELKKTVLSVLSQSDEDAILASTLMQTDEWTMENGTITSTVASNFAVMQIKNSLPKINAVISQYYGSSVNFAVHIRQEKKTEEKEILPREVQLVCSLFSGRVVAEGEILETNADSKQEPSSDSEKTEEEQVSEIQTEYTEDEE